MFPAQCLFSSILTPRNVVCVPCSMFVFINSYSKECCMCCLLNVCFHQYLLQGMLCVFPAQCLFSSIVTPRNVVCVPCSMFVFINTYSKECCVCSLLNVCFHQYLLQGMLCVSPAQCLFHSKLYAHLF